MFSGAARLGPPLNMAEGVPDCTILRKSRCPLGRIIAQLTGSIYVEQGRDDAQPRGLQDLIRWRCLRQPPPMEVQFCQPRRIRRMDSQLILILIVKG